MERKTLGKYLIIGVVILLIGASINVQAENKGKNISNSINDIKPVPAGSIDRILLGYWSLDDNAGSTPSDDSGHGCDGTINGVATWIPGKIKSGLGFDGGSNYIILDSNVTDLAFDSNGDYTVSMWITLDSHKDSILYQICDLTGSEPGFKIATDSSGHIKASFSNGVSNKIEAISEDTIPTGENWHHIVVIYRKGPPARIEIYIDTIDDGFDEGTIPSFQKEDFDNVKIGRDAINTGGYFHGWMDEIRVYNRALSHNEIQFLYDKPSGLKYTLIFGKFDNLNMNAGNFVTFDCANVWTRKYFPFTKGHYSNLETIRVDPVYKAYININLKIGIGIFLSNV